MDRENELIETDRLLMRRVRPEDSILLADICTDERVYRYLRRRSFKTQLELRMWLEKKQPACKDQVVMIATDKSESHVVGLYAVNFECKRNIWNISYLTGYDDWGKGYATEAMKALITHMSIQYAAKCFEGECAVENPASAHVMKRLGMKYVRKSFYEKHDGSERFESEVYQLEMK